MCVMRERDYSVPCLSAHLDPCLSAHCDPCANAHLAHGSADVAQIFFLGSRKALFTVPLHNVCECCYYDGYFSENLLWSSHLWRLQSIMLSSTHRDKRFRSSKKPASNSVKNVAVLWSWHSNAVLELSYKSWIDLDKDNTMSLRRSIILP